MPVEDRGTRDQIGQMARPVEVPWACKKTGDCCRHPKQLVVSRNEQTLMEQHAGLARRLLIWERHDDPKFAILSTGPCPFLADNNECLIYASRPFNCRRFMCGRVDVEAESFEMGGPLGSYNLSDRIETSRRFMEFYQSREHHAQKWAKEHGWGRR